MPSVWDKELEARNVEILTCQRCFRPFEFKPILKWPLWKPKHCFDCKELIRVEQQLRGRRIRF